MKTGSAASPNPGSTAADKFTWLLDRYFRLDRDDTLIARLKSLFETNAQGHLTPTPLLDPLTGETRGLMVLGNFRYREVRTDHADVASLPVFDLAGREQDGNTLYVTVPPEATIKSLAGRIAKDLGYVDINPRAGANEAWDVARHRMRERGIRPLVIDETHHLLRKCSGRDVEGAVQTLKSLLQGDWPVAVIAARSTSCATGSSPIRKPAGDFRSSSCPGPKRAQRKLALSAAACISARKRSSFRCPLMHSARAYPACGRRRSRALHPSGEGCPEEGADRRPDQGHDP